MKTSDYKASAFSSGIGSFLMIATMVSHPVGGDIEALQRVSLAAIISHSLAIFSVPFTYLGFKGLTSYLKADWFWSQAGMTFFLFSSVVVLLAATVNGLVLPFFVEGLDASDEASLDGAYWVIRYNHRVNRAYDLVFMTALCLAAFCWSVTMLRQQLLGKALALFGTLLGVTGATVTLSGTLITNLHDFRIFIFGYVVWALWVGVALFAKGKG